MAANHRVLWFLELASKSKFPLKLLVKKKLFEATLNRGWHNLELSVMLSTILGMSNDYMIEFLISELADGGNLQKLENPKDELALIKMLKRLGREHLSFQMTDLGAQRFVEESKPDWEKFIQYSVINYCNDTDTIHVKLEANSEMPLQHLSEMSRAYYWHKDLDFSSFQKLENWYAFYWKKFKTGVSVEMKYDASIIDLTQIINVGWRENGFDNVECATVLDLVGLKKSSEDSGGKNTTQDE